ncbi:MBL fold metallo-hydrolase [Paenirhodobacter populi]|uniref:MBL fold metallo-hydrolase n=1 Tax=Paenirhodobacter populi TaxID=2306993 RepID=UPI000FE2D6B8|nr:MBL fold metallo-hydrolase [Sinirhodobacter populi]RWR11310.1 MBL fold metallo-hydrolase [Sinirhodobacter populi]
MPDPARFEILSGLGAKGPACIRLRTGRHVWLLDVGSGPEADAPFRPEWLDGADAVFISHDHVDHVGGAVHAVRAGLPICCTAQTARALPPGARVQVLPERGETVIDGIRLVTGRDGHALGGIWMWFDLGEGLFYSGDWSAESRWFAFDMPRVTAGTALIDCSYRRDDVSQHRRRAELDATLDALEPGVQVLFPVPPSGRAGELALHLLPRGGVTLDDTCREAVRAALASDGVTPRARDLRALLDRPFDPAARYLICDTPDADGGMAARMVRDWRGQGRLGRDARVVFTGHMTAPARAIADEGGLFRRWNVHPPLHDQIAMVRQLRARRFAPLFCEDPADYLSEPRFGAVPLLDGWGLL